jgi:nitroreductase
MEIGQSTASDQSWLLVSEAIRARRSNLNVDLERAVPIDVIDELVGLAIFAPNHYRTNPWRFVVLTGRARARLGDVVAGVMAEQAGAKEAAVERQRAQFLRSPAVLVVASAGDPDPIKQLENKHAVAAGIENVLIGATAAGLASAWKSGPAMTDPEVSAAVKAALGIPAEDEIVGFVYLGYPIGAPGAIVRPEARVTYVSE